MDEEFANETGTTDETGVTGAATYPSSQDKHKTQSKSKSNQSTVQSKTKKKGKKSNNDAQVTKVARNLRSNSEKN